MSQLKSLNLDSDGNPVLNKEQEDMCHNAAAAKLIALNMDTYDKYLNEYRELLLNAMRVELRK